MGCDFYGTLKQIHEKLDAPAYALQLPLGAEENFEGIIDLLNMKARVYKDELGSEYVDNDIPEDLLDEAQLHREELIEKLSEFDDVLMEKFLANQEITVEELKKVIRKATINNKIIPVYVAVLLRIRVCNY